MRSVEEAQSEILGAVAPLGAESVLLLDSLGRVLAEDLVAERTLPPWDNSEMDGYAVHAADTARAPVVLALQGEAAAGRPAAEPLRPGHAYRIFTGAPLPTGANAVVKQEDVEIGDGVVRLRAPVREGESVRSRGSDVAPGERALRRGAVMKAGEVGLCAALGRTQVQVHRRPLVAILSTGDELVEPDRAPGPGQIVNSNSLAVAALVREIGATPVRLGVVPDDPKAIEARIQEARFADLLLTIGGVSVGDHDHVRDVLAALGCELRFWKVRVKPGKPLVFGLWNGRPVLGLPGNPVSSMVTFELFARPALLKLMGRAQVERYRTRARLLAPVGKDDDRRHYLRAVVSRDGEELVVRVLSKQSSGQLSSMVGVNAFAILPEEARGAAEGEILEVLLLDEPRLWPRG
jgi:molybdopterin molybdotransferase